MGSSEGQTYCLRWNNHKSNLVEILDALIKMESYVDCTIVVDEQVQFKAHRVVLAANSPYFQSILQDVPMDHCSILFPGVQAFEMRALLEYMYTGEVNVTQSQIPRIMKIAEQLEVKGLFDMTDLKEKFTKFEDNGPPNHTPYNVPFTPPLPPPQHQQSSPVITTSSNITQHQAQSSSSPPPSYLYKSPYSSLYTKSPGPSEHRRSIDDRNERYNSSNERHETQERGLHNERNTERVLDKSPPSQTQQRSITPPPSQPPPSSSQQHTPWPISSVIGPGSIPTSAAAAAMLSSVYESAPDMNPLKRKKLSSISSMLMASDTPILRNVLAQSHAADSSQPMPLIKQERENEKQGPLNCSGPLDYNNEKYAKYDEPHSPFMDKSCDDDQMFMKNDCSPNERLGNMSYSSNNNSQKPEWKRYKQYTRSDILAAIECVRNGMSALQASRKFGVPSRTLYDKVKKLGITTGRPMNRTIKRSPSTGSSSASFPFGLSGTAHPAYSQAEAMLSQMHESNELHSSHLRGNNNSSNGNGNGEKEHREHHLPPNLPHPAAAALLDPTFLQQAFESRGGDIAGREALHAMALAAAAHAAVNGISTSPGTNGTARSPSPGFALKYSRSHQNSPPPTSTTNMNLNRSSSSSTYSRHQLRIPQDTEHNMHNERNLKRECIMKYDRELDNDDDDDDDDDNEQDRVEDLSVNRKSITVQQNLKSPSPTRPLSPSSSSHPPHSPTLQPPLPLPSRSPSSLHQTNNESNHHLHQSHHNKNTSSSSSSTSYNTGNQQSTGVIMPPIISKLSSNTISETTTTTTDYPVSHESTVTSAPTLSMKRELIAEDETRD
ncbi:broad-complex core protein [Condylostylus longicornis]|uniref:broad-complex core protein n=1 Tax=Condylostylus longicornis TaxID=2530218 RepID=UPI00244E2F8E|nr:broad-complex core protein [Condylostylus longicornis]